MDSKLLGFLIALAIQTIIGIVGLSIFANFRDSQPDLYFKLTKPSYLPAGLLGWMKKVYSEDNMKLGDRHPDAFVVVELLGLLFKIALVFSSLGMLVILPINITGDNGENALQLLTAANVKDESYLFCAHATVVLISVAAGAYFVKQTTDKFAEWRQTQLQRPIPENYFALVRGIGASDTITYTPGQPGAAKNVSQNPEALGQTIGQQLQEATGVEKASPRANAPAHLHNQTEFEQSRVTAVTLFCKTEGEDELQETTAARDEAEAIKVQAEAEWAVIRKEAAEEGKLTEITDEDRPSHRHDGYVCCGGEVVDTIKWCEETRLPELSKKLAEVDVCKLKPLHAGVVGFNSAKAAHDVIGVNADTFSRGSLYQGHVFEKIGATEVWRAPAPHDVCWETMGELQSPCNTRLAHLKVFLFTSLFSIIVAFVAGLANTDKINDKCGCLGFIDGMDDTSKALMQDLLPVVVLIIFLSLVTGFFYSFHAKENWVGYSQIMHSSFQSHFIFLFFNLFIVYLISGSLFDEMESLLDNPSDAASALGRAIPSNSRFFTIYIMSLGFGGMPLRLSLIGPLIVGNIKRKFLAKSAKDHKEAMTVPPFDIMNEAPHFLVVLAISSTYSTIAPIVAPFTIVYFGLAYLVVKQQFLCVLRTGRSCAFWDPAEYDSAGVVMCSMIRYVLFALLTSALLSSAYLFVRQSYAAGVIALLTVPYLIFEWWRIGRKLDLTPRLQPTTSTIATSSQSVALDQLFQDQVEDGAPSAGMQALYYQRSCVQQLDIESCWSFCSEDLLGAAPEHVASGLAHKSDAAAPTAAAPTESSGQFERVTNEAPSSPQRTKGRPAAPAPAAQVDYSADETIPM
jgi:hypothetical protein